jgi:hypothetical protein
MKISSTLNFLDIISQIRSVAMFVVADYILRITS